MKNATQQAVNPVMAVAIVVLGVLSLGAFAFSYEGSAPKVVVEGDYIEAEGGGESLGLSSGTFSSRLDEGEITVWNDGQFDDLVVEDELTVEGRFTQGGTSETITTSSASYTLDASDICDNSLLTLTSLSGVTTWTFPSTSTIASDCLLTDGNFVDLTIQNGSGTTSSILAVPTGYTFLKSVSSTISASDGAELRVTRKLSTSILATLVNVLSSP